MSASSSRQRALLSSRDNGDMASAGSHRRAFTLGAVRPAVLLLAKTLFVPLASAAPFSLFQRDTFTLFEDPEDAPKDPGDPDLWLYLLIAAALVVLGGLFAGLTIAFMGQDETYLQVIATSGEARESRHATKVLNLLKKGKHWVLVTLLLGNVITNETLPIVLDRSLGGGWPAVLSSTVLIVIFGEIAPQSVCVRYGLSIGAYMTPLVLLLMWVMCPVAWPTAKLLDWILGEDHGTMYKKAGLKTLVQLHKTLGTTPGERLMEDEVTIINSVLDLKDKPVGDIMTPMQDVFIMSADTVLDERMMDTILSQGYSRIPIYAPDNQRNFIGMLLVKILITYDPEDAMRVRDFSLATLPETAPYTSCLDIINFFQEGKSHMVLVSDFPGQDKGALGVVTLEDVIEELIGEEIIDESDVFVDVHKAIRRMAPAPHQRYQKRASMDPIVSNDSAVDAREDEPLLGNGEVKERRQASLPGATTFLVRRKSSTASEGARDFTGSNVVPVRSNTQEMREHLRHLGPSNVASRPRATKFSNVKIKPGIGTIPEDQSTAPGLENGGAKRIKRSQSHEEASRPAAVRAFTSDGTEGSGLLKSAGREASDGAAALRAGYGTLSPSNEVPKIAAINPDEQTMSASEASRIAERKAFNSSSTADGPKNRDGSDRLQVPQGTKVPGKVVVGDSTGEEVDELGEMSFNGSWSAERSRSRNSRGVRSGSITETEVEIGGMKKVVLDISESSSEEGLSTRSGAASQVDDDEDTDEGGIRSGTATPRSGTNGAKKRRKRGKKKKDGSGS